jgi:hypothetical protein
MYRNMSYKCSIIYSHSTEKYSLHLCRFSRHRSRHKELHSCTLLTKLILILFMFIYARKNSNNVDLRFFFHLT